MNDSYRFEIEQSHKLSKQNLNAITDEPKKWFSNNSVQWYRVIGITDCHSLLQLHLFV